MAVSFSGAKKILENLPDEHWLKNNEFLKTCCLVATNSADKTGSTVENTSKNNEQWDNVNNSIGWVQKLIPSRARMMMKVTSKLCLS